MLIIPALHIHKGRCTRTAKGESGTEGRYPHDPVQVARLWRGENAKALHVASLDGSGAGLDAAFNVLADIAAAVDIPVQFSGAIAHPDEVARAFNEAGVSRVVLPASVVRDPAVLARFLDRFGPRKIVVEAAPDGMEIISQGSDSAVGEEWISLAAQWKSAGLQRIVIRDGSGRAQLHGVFSRFLLSLAERTNLSVTLNGSVREYKDLSLLQNLHPRKIDSIILDEALYSNAYPRPEDLA
ncbi:MAG: HisA/HisF-related TIM barrel protein [Bacteroidota bacterium]|nr:HisA/HisF-related TIM barrel protein [Bacteroidota bacterium]